MLMTHRYSIMGKVITLVNVNTMLTVVMVSKSKITVADWFTSCDVTGGMGGTITSV